MGSAPETDRPVVGAVLTEAIVQIDVVRLLVQLTGYRYRALRCAA